MEKRATTAELRKSQIDHEYDSEFDVIWFLDWRNQVSLLGKMTNNNAVDKSK